MAIPLKAEVEALHRKYLSLCQLLSAHRRLVSEKEESLKFRARELRIRYAHIPGEDVSKSILM